MEGEAEGLAPVGVGVGAGEACGLGFRVGAELPSPHRPLYLPPLPTQRDFGFILRACASISEISPVQECRKRIICYALAVRPPGWSGRKRAVANLRSVRMPHNPTPRYPPFLYSIDRCRTRLWHSIDFIYWTYMFMTQIVSP